MDRSPQSIAASLDLLEKEAAAGRLGTKRFTLTEICAARQPLYLAFRWPEQRWQAGRPALAAWLAQVAALPSIHDTEHSLL